MAAFFQIFLVMVFVLAAVAVIARRINIAPAILLMITGVALAFVPGLPRLELAPELVLLVVLPPLIYSAGFAMSWREFKFNLRPIGLLAVGCVIFTTCAIALAAHLVLGAPWGVGFVLGAIIAPPDVVAPLAVAKRLNLPQRILVILEGEGLANDATALILYRFAVAAVSTGVFSFPQAATSFIAIIIGEVMFGIAVGWATLHLRRLANEPRVEIAISLLTPYFAFWIPEHLGGSGVLATVATGLYLSWNGPLMISAATRLQGVFFWDLVIFLIEGLLFLITGFQLRFIIEKAQNFSFSRIAIATLIIAAVMIVARFAWVFVATYLPRRLSTRLQERDQAPPWRHVFVIAFTGVRGAVSLAAALALPFTLASGEAFPYRDDILIITFGIIMLTLVGMGLGLPGVVRALGLARHGYAEMKQQRFAEIEARRDALDMARRSLDTIAAERSLSSEVVTFMTTRHDNRLNQIPDLSVDGGYEISKEGAALQRDLIGAERVYLHKLLREGKISDESRRRIERDLDLEEASIANRQHTNLT